MTGATIAQLLAAFGPSALKWINDLVKVWNKTLTADEVLAITAVIGKSYDDYINEARG